MNVSKRRLSSPAAALPWLLLGASCTTTPPRYVEVQLPAYASAIFVECASTNGALAFKVNQNGQTVEAADLEWAAKSSGDWGLASYSPMGQTLFQIQFQKQKQSFEATGRGGATPMAGIDTRRAVAARSTLHFSQTSRHARRGTSPSVAR